MTNEEAIAQLQRWKAYMDSLDADEDERLTVESLDAAIEALHERKTGKWISEWRETEVTIDENGFTTGSCHCSACGDWLVASDEYPTRGRYCPNCGAKMEVEI